MRTPKKRALHKAHVNLQEALSRLNDAAALGEHKPRHLKAVSDAHAEIAACESLPNNVKCFICRQDIDADGEIEIFHVAERLTGGAVPARGESYRGCLAFPALYFCLSCAPAALDAFNADNFGDDE